MTWNRGDYLEELDDSRREEIRLTWEVAFWVGAGMGFVLGIAAAWTWWWVLRG